MIIYLPATRLTKRASALPVGAGDAGQIAACQAANIPKFCEGRFTRHPLSSNLIRSLFCCCHPPHPYNHPDLLQKEKGPDAWSEPLRRPADTTPPAGILS